MPIDPHTPASKTAAIVVSVDEVVNGLFDECIPAVKDFIKDATESGLDNISNNAWFNVLSTISALVIHAKGVDRNKATQRRIVYLLLKKLLEDDSVVPLKPMERRVILELYSLGAPRIIEMLIPPQKATKGCGACFPSWFRRRSSKE